MDAILEAPSFVEIRDPGDSRFDAMIALYEAAIPERERKSIAAVRAMIASPKHRVVIACRGGSVEGFFLLYVGARIALLEYLATEARLRGRGLGAHLYAQARRAAGDRPLIVEVESDREDCADRPLRARRILFYRRLGCRRVADLDFILPLPGSGAPPRLDLLVDQVPDDHVERAQFETWLREMYDGVYGCQADDPRLRKMISGLRDPVRLT
ncbi:GNAT family N-acetyltransferase [Allosphingosinicella deserti]|nr:GNAT family N-acetyltransferase [Sphingomonas deserti]